MSAKRKRITCSALAAFMLLLSLSAGASAAGDWTIVSASNPSAAPGTDVVYRVTVVNEGDRPLPETPSGTADNCTPGAVPPATPEACYGVTATFPPELTPVDGVGFPFGSSCTIDGVANSITCQVTGESTGQQMNPIAPGTAVQLRFTATVDPSASGTLTSTFEISGAGAPSKTAADATRITSALEFGIGEFDAAVMADAAGNPLTQAGGRPFAASTSIEFNSYDHPNFFFGPLWPVEATKDIVVDLPPGFVGNPTAVDQCTAAELANGFNIQPRPLCPPTSQIGVYETHAAASEDASYSARLPLFNMVPPPGVPARFGFNVAGTVITLDAELRSDSDYGLSVRAHNIPQGYNVQGTQLTLWGVPSASIHDPYRACPGDVPPTEGGRRCGSGAPPRAFLRNPTSCTPDGVGLPTTIRATSWQDPNDVKSLTIDSHLPPGYPSAPADWGRRQGPDNCELVPFRPTFRGTPETGAKASAPAGFSFDLTLPQPDDPNGIATADLKKAVVTLPRGLRVSPSSAGGLAGCSAAQIGLDSRADPTCPSGSKIGALTIVTPLLSEALEGDIYLATPFDNPFDSLIAIYIVARGPGLIVKLPGKVDMNQASGGPMVATFDDNPQLPFSNLHLEFKGGERAPLAMPRCGTYTIRSELTSWSGKTVAVDDDFTVSENASGQPCPPKFSPGFEAGTRSSRAGSSSTFLLRLTRDDADEELSGLSLDMPQGLVGRIADATLCSDGAAAAGTCSDASKVGSVTVGAGAGANPFYITNGRAYLTGPYRGAPFGLSIVVPAIAGPFDLGTVVVRSAVRVDKHTAEVSVDSDPLPTQLEGIQLDVKDVRVNVDRPGFWLNPTSCDEKTIKGSIRSTAGSTATVSSRFQAYDCAALRLTPRMRLTVGGRGRTQRGRTTPFSTTLTMPSATQSNLRGVRVTLPTTINARLTVINDACTRAQYEAGNCENARTGSATAVTPLLRNPLRGGVYFVRNGNPLPDLFVRLRGQVDFDLVGRITIPGSKRLRTTFDRVPDVPVSTFSLRLDGGREGSVGNAANLCSARARRAKAELDYVGQNGRAVHVDQRLQVRGCRARGRRGRRGRGRRGRRR